MSIEAAPEPAAKLSVALAADSHATIRPVLNRLRAQTIHRDIEVVIATPAPDALRAEIDDPDAFAGIRIVRIDALSPLGNARAAAVRAATAPFVFLGETHSFAEERWAEALLARHAEGWAVVVPGIVNANPHGTLSWAGFLLDYGAWLEDLPAGEIAYWPLNNASCRREALLECGSDLERALAYGDQLLLFMRERGHHVFFEPSARLRHLNVARLGAWLDERWIGGFLVAWHRSRDWTAWRRLAYVLGSPLIPLVCLARIGRAARESARRRRLPYGVLPGMLLGACVHAVGEMVGYARIGIHASAEARMTEYEIHKARYVRSGS